MARTVIGQYYKVDVNLPDHEKFVDLTDTAFRLWHHGLAYANRLMTDGFIATAVARRLVDPDPHGQGWGWKDHADALVAAQLWREVEGGYQIHDFSDHNPLKEERLERREEERQRKAAYRAGKRVSRPKDVPTGQPRDSDEMSHGTSPTGDEVSPVVRDRDRDRDRVPPSAGRDAPAADPPTLTLVSSDTAAALEPAQPPPPAEQPATAQTLLAEHLDACPKRPPKRVVSHLGRELKQLLDEGIDPAAVRAGLAIVRERGLHPSTLASCVNEALNPPRPRGRDRPGKAQRQVQQVAEVYQRMQRNGPPKGGMFDDVDELGGVDGDRRQARPALAGPADQRRDRGRLVDGVAHVQRG